MDRVTFKENFHSHPASNASVCLTCGAMIWQWPADGYWLEDSEFANKHLEWHREQERLRTSTSS